MDLRPYRDWPQVIFKGHLGQFGALVVLDTNKVEGDIECAKLRFDSVDMVPDSLSIAGVKRGSWSQRSLSPLIYQQQR